jgi:DNA-binding transcriptional LysR family regulator
VNDERDQLVAAYKLEPSCPGPPTDRACHFHPIAPGVAILRQLAVQDMGIVNLPEHAAAQELAAGLLENILPDWQ